MTNEGLFYTESEISKLAGIPPRALRRAMRILREERIVTRERRRGTFHYSADRSSERTGGLLSYVDSTLMSNLADMKSA